MTESRTAASPLPILFALAGAKLLLHLAVNLWGGYGIFRDELYYLACASHPAWGYVDQPPLSILLLAGVRAVVGDSVFALRLLPAVAGAGVVLVTGLLARELGGGRFAVALAALAAIVAPVNLAFSAVWSMNVFDLLITALAALWLARLLRTGEARWWIPLGLTLGLGLANKVGVLWVGLGVAVGLVATRQRRWLATPWPWAAGAIATLFFAPYVLWNAAHDWPHLEFIGRAVSGKYSGLSAWSFLSGLVPNQNPVTLPLWLAGLAWLLLAPGGRPYRPLGLVWLTACAVLLANGHSKSEYLASLFAILYAAGGVAGERFLLPRRWARGAALVVLTLGLALAPFAVPLLPVDLYVRYAAALGVAPSTAERKELADLPQFFADMHGWEEKAAAVAEVVRSLSPEERAGVVVFGGNYGRAGAIDYFRDEHDLPPAIGSHNNYWLWGPGGASREVVVVLGGEREDLERRCASVEVAGVARCEHCMPYENELPIHLCRGLLLTWEELWPLTKHYE